MKELSKEFPKKIYVTFEGEGEDEFLLLSTLIDDIDEDAGKVAIYELKEVKKLKVTRELR